MGQAPLASGGSPRSSSLHAASGLAEGRCLPRWEIGPSGDVWWLWGAGWDQRTWNSSGGGRDGSRARQVCAWGDPGCAGCVLGWGGSCGTGWVAVGQGSDRLGTLRVWGGCEQEPPGLTPSARGAGLPGAGVRGAGGGDRVPAGPPGESPHVSRTPRWGWGSHTVPPATRPTWGPPPQPRCHKGEGTSTMGSRRAPRVLPHPVLSVPTLASCRRGVPGKRCGTILLLAEELSNCRVSAGIFGARGEEPA